MSGDDVPAMREAALRFLGALDGERAEAARAGFGSGERTEWSYLPGPRPGLPLVEMTAEQEELALTLLETGCSAAGAEVAHAIIALERIRRRLVTGVEEIDGDRYWFRIFGDPAGDGPWMWRVNGHHLAIHVTVAGGECTVTPSFLGSEPAMVLSGPQRGLRVLAEEEELGRALLADLAPDQRRAAIVDETAPDDILTRVDPVVDLSGLPPGVAYGGLSASSKDLLERLVRRYFQRSPAGYAEASWRRVLDAGLDKVTFAWAGSDRRGEGHYYRVAGPTFLLEYDNTQDDANHVHSVWRDPRYDWGGDLLARHYAADH
ncbi:hypothetical protein C1I98_06875 [Spongiactinospora gelatinilytica]|uniref:DUF3500 domain-containing protein n=1 Tax=Spongiactinospora gelatinilytica TaxID=2666298 RepID=A0A2W2HCZ5_9ACTN|nr:DUF3500 domain-containing protein [Spongiactinospora gelatinilytica]PZG52799.1 hypothetical protein C1I98_06875 [Spongiactinospora gelatinilytica]